MSVELLGELNWLAVAVAALAYFALGGLWFIPRVFGDVWMDAIGWEPADDDQPSPALYLGPLVTCLIATIALAVLARAAGADGVVDGVVLGAVAGVGIAGTALFVTGYFDPKKRRPMTWFVVTGGYHIVGLVIASVIVSVWR